MEKNKVLIVDDISENIETISEMIKDFDIDVKTANGGKEAIELIDTFKPHVILLDLMMPNVNGWDVIDHVRSKYSKSEMVIIVVSLLSNKDEPTLKSKACLKCLYFTIIIFDLCRYLEYFSYLCTINQTE